jgi:hypothetical protein
MPLNFHDQVSGERIGSTILARNVLDLATREVDPALNSRLLGIQNWRKQYQKVYRELAQVEFYQEQNLLEIAKIGLAEISNSIQDETGTKLPQIIDAGWSGREMVETFTIQGVGPAKHLRIPGISSLTDAAQIWTHDNLAEPGLVASFSFLDAHKKLPINMDILVALAGAAEYAPTKYWLDLGGTVAVAARPSTDRWIDLIAYARQSAGTLLVPVIKRRLEDETLEMSDVEIARKAGLDLVEDATVLASWVSSIASNHNQRIVLGQYAYAPGAKHILVQAVQDAVADVMCRKLAPSRVALAWLATPTDSTAVPARVLEHSLDAHSSRSLKIKVRDSILGLKVTSGSFFETRFGEKLALLDPTSSFQGPSYALAKRSQRWRAYLANSQGVKVSYAVSPPAKTYSVLSFRALNATYRGAPRFGLQPFEVADAAIAATAVLLRDLHGPMHSRGSTSLHTDNAVHGGLWRLSYPAESVWTRATVLGWKGLFTRRSVG